MGDVCVHVCMRVHGVREGVQMWDPKMLNVDLVAMLQVHGSRTPNASNTGLPAGFFTPRAEMTNGRAAMLAWAALLGLEYAAGVPFF